MINISEAQRLYRDRTLSFEGTQIENEIKKAIMSGCEYIQVQTEDQKVDGELVCISCTIEDLSNLQRLGYFVDGPRRLIMNVYFPYELGYKTIMGYKISGWAE